MVARNTGVFRQISAVFGARTFAAVVQAVLLVVLARLLGPSDFGSFVVGLTAGALIGVATGMGSAMQALLLDRRLAHRSIGTTLLAMRVSTGLLAALAAAAVCVALGLPLMPALVCGLWSWAEVVIELVQALLLGQGRVRAATWCILVRRIGPGLALVGWVVIGHSVWEWLIAGYAAALLATCVAARGLLARPGGLGPILRSSRHFWTSTVLSTLQTADVAVVGVFAQGSATVGHYAAAARATSPLNLLTGSLVSVLTPRWAQLKEMSIRHASFLRARRGLFGLAALLVVASPVAGWLAPLVLGEAYAGSSVFFVGVTVAAGVSAIVQGYSAFLFASEAPDRVARARVWSIPGGLVCVGVAAWFGSPLALAFAPVVSQCLQLMAMSRATGNLLRS